MQLKYNTANIHSADHETLSTRYYPFTGKVSDPMLVFVHGLGGDQVAWEFVIEELEARQVKLQGVVTYDLRGHSNSTRKITEPDYLDMARQDLEAVVDKYVSQNTSYWLAGHSLGALIVQTYLNQHPAHLPSAVALISCPGYTKGLKVPRTISNWLFRRSALRLVCVRSRIEHEKYVGTPNIHLGRLLSDIRTMGLFHFLGLYSFLGGLKANPDDFALKQINTAVVVGKRDIFFSVGEMQAFAKQINAQMFRVVENGNHCLPTNSAKELSYILQELLEA